MNVECVLVGEPSCVRRVADFLTPSPPGTPGGEGWGEGGQDTTRNLDVLAASAPSPPTPLPRSTGGEGRELPAARRTSRDEAAERGIPSRRGSTRLLTQLGSPWICIAIIFGIASLSRAEEIYFQDGKRMMAMIEAIEPDGKVTVRLPGGQMTTAHVTQISSIAFRGRENKAVRAGAQELHFVTGDRLLGQVIKLENDRLLADTATVGAVPIPLATLRGFLTMPVEGKAGRRATELVTGDDDDATGKMDQILDRRASGYEGVIEAMDAKELHLDHERLRKIIPLSIMHLAGVRLARDAQMPVPKLPTQPFVKVRTRDGSSLDGLIESVRFGKWNLRPTWEPDKLLSVPVDEVVSVEVLNGQAIYLSQLAPADVKEKTILTPQQRYRLNQNCQGGPLSVGGNLFAWGIGVHANSSLSFDLAGTWSKFEAVAGIDDQAGKGGSVVFQVFGDGKELYKSPVVRGMETAAQISVPIKGLKRLTLVVDATDDLDLGDLANWAGARLVR